MPQDAKILVVDDSPLVLKVVSNILSAEGYKVETCGEIDQVSQLASKIRPHLILLDIMMPSKEGLDGFSLLNQLKENRATWEIPIIFLSGIAQWVQQTEEELRKKVGAADFISKPFDPANLVLRVKKLLKKGKGTT